MFELMAIEIVALEDFGHPLVQQAGLRDVVKDSRVAAHRPSEAGDGLRARVGVSRHSASELRRLIVPHANAGTVGQDCARMAGAR